MPIDLKGDIERQGNKLFSAPWMRLWVGVPPVLLPTCHIMNEYRNWRKARYSPNGNAPSQRADSVHSVFLEEVIPLFAVHLIVGNEHGYTSTNQKQVSVLAYSRLSGTWDFMPLSDTNLGEEPSKRYKGFTGYWILLTSSIETPQVRPGASQSSFTKCKILEATHSGLLLIILWSMGSCFQFIFAPTVLNNSLVFSNWESCIKTRCQSSVFLNTNPHA